MSNKFGNDFNEVVKDLDGTAHVGGFPAHAIVIEPVEEFFVIWKENIRPDKAVKILEMLAKNIDYPWVRIHSVNQKTKVRVNTIHAKSPSNTN